jgi:anti-sigma factor RsiW
VKRTWSGKRVSFLELKRLIGVSLPAKLTGGFKANSTSVVRSSPVTAQLTYTDGLASISLFASAAKTDASPGEQVRHKTTTFGHLTSVSWQADKLSYTLVGDVSQRALLDIAKSLIP